MTHRSLFAYAPFGVLVLSFVLNVTGVSSDTLALVVSAAAVFYCLGQASIIIPEAKRERQEAIAHTEEFIALIDHELIGDEIDEEEREYAERMLADLTRVLAVMEGAAPPWTRWRERRARERQAR